MNEVTRRLATVTAVSATTGQVTLDLFEDGGIPCLRAAGPLAVDDVVLVDLYAGSAVVIGKPSTVPAGGAVTIVPSGTQATSAGTETFWTALQTPVVLAAGRRYRITVTIRLDAGAASQCADIRVRNSKSASAPTTASALAAEWRWNSVVSIATHHTWVGYYTADTDGVNTFGVSAIRQNGANNITMGPAALLAIEEPPNP